MANNKTESQLILESYVGEEYPDCGEAIPRNVLTGDECANCGHIFTAQS
jgi:hypothetical protein